MYNTQPSTYAILYGKPRHTAYTHTCTYMDIPRTPCFVYIAYKCTCMHIHKLTVHVIQTTRTLWGREGGEGSVITHHSSQLVPRTSSYQCLGCLTWVPSPLSPGVGGEQHVDILSIKQGQAPSGLAFCSSTCTCMYRCV